MEGKKEQEKKLTYDELSKAASELHVQYQKLMSEYQKAMTALNDRGFDYTSFFLQMLFKVMEHPEMYSEKFTKWASENIENLMISLADTLNKKPEENQEEKKDEA